MEQGSHMTTFGYHASHEQFAPSDLVRYVQRAESAGFQGAMCSDHFMPWSDAQGQSGYAWSWLGAAMQATSLSFGMVTAPGQRYHPAILAQAAATLAEMFPDRLWVSVGSGEAINEHITGEPWPTKPERNARLKECVDVIRALWAGETVSHDGRVRVSDARLYTRPDVAPAILVAALSAETAEWAGSWADGLITVSQPPDVTREVIDAFRRGGGEGKPMFLQVKVSYAETDELARRSALEQWGTNILTSRLLADLPMPAHYEDIGKYVRQEDLDGSVLVSSSLDRHVEWLREYAAMGFEHLYLHNVNRDQESFIDAFGRHVLPAFGE